MSEHNYEDSESWTQKIAWGGLIAFFIGMVSWAGWASVELHDKVSYSQFNQLKKDLPYPYLQDKHWIEDELQELNQAVNGSFSTVIRENTKAIVRLQEQLNYNSKILEKVEKSITKEYNTR